MILRQYIPLKVFAALILTCAAPLLTFSQTIEEPAYTLVRDIYGRPLGLTYNIKGNESLTERGELALHTAERLFLFVSCGKRELRAGEQFMRRHNRNCNNDLTIWPASLLTSAVPGLAALGIPGESDRTPVRLTGPPTTCGVCRPLPYSDFVLPPGVEVISEDLIMSLIESVVEEAAVSAFPGDTPPPRVLAPGLRVYGGAWRFTNEELTQFDGRSREAVALWDMLVPERAEYSLAIEDIDPGEDDSGSLIVRLPLFNFGIAWDPQYIGASVRGEIQWTALGEDADVRYFELPGGLASYIEAGMEAHEPFDIRLRLDSIRGDVYFKDPRDEDTWWTVVSDQELFEEGYNQIGVGTKSLSARFGGFSVGNNW